MMQDQFDPDSAAAWQVRLFKKSLTKQARLESLQRFLPETNEKICLDVGGGSGVIPYLLRRRGGSWVSADSRPQAVASMQELFGEEQVFDLQGAELPFEDDTFDVIVIIEYLESIREDATFLKECHRCLSEEGELIIHVPHVKSFSLNRGLRNLLGLTDEKFGRLRPGYRLSGLYEISKDGYDIVENLTYGGYLVESLESWIQFFSGAADEEVGEPPERQGTTMGQRDLRRFSKQYRLYSLMYPFQKLSAGLDRLFSFTRNHYLVIKARPRPWVQRRGVRMRDGRSIADAAINTKIGTAADLTDPKNNRSNAG